MDEDEDTPILEIPVHVSKRLAENLYIFQYLNKLPHNNMTKENIKKCSVKPKFQEVNLEVGLNTESMNYDTSKGENFAINVDGMTGLIADTKEEKKFFDSEIMDKQTYKTTKAVSDCSNYAVGVLSQNEIHLTPLKGILHLRPSLEHLDKSDKRNKTKEQKTAESEDEQEPSTSSVEKVTVRFARAETERDKKAREQSFDHFSKQFSEEPWIETKWFHSNTHEAELERMCLYAPHSQDVRHTVSLPNDNYTSQLIPKSEVDYEAPILLSDTAISIAALKTLPLVEQCRNLIKDAKILNFEQIVKLLSIDMSKRDELLRALPSSAVLVKGLWVAKSELIYPTNTFSKISGVPAEFMCRARDYVLYLLTSSDYVNRRKVASTVKIPADELMEIFEGVSKYEKHKGWQLLLPPDEQFIARYPDVVQRQQLFWETKSKQFIQYIKEFSKTVRNRKKSNRESVSSVSDVEIVPKMNGVKKQRDNSCSSDTDSGTEKSKKSSAGSRKRTKVNRDSNSANLFMEKPITLE